MYWMEVRKEITRPGPPELVPLSPKHDGYQYRSVFAYGDEVAYSIRSSGNTRDLKTKPVYSDTLYIDVDSDNTVVQAVGDKLCERRVRFEYWTTGNRGAHFHIPIQPMCGIMVPYSQRMWVTEVMDGIEVDTSIYIATGQIRLPGAIHEKTGKNKRILESIRGNLLEIPMIEVKTMQSKAPWERVATTKYSYIDNLTRPRGSGQRHRHIMIIVKEGIALEYSLDKILTDLIEWNRAWNKNPLPDYELISHAERTYGRLT